MSDATGADPVAGIASRLRELAEELRRPEIGDERAAELAREAADLAAGAGNEIERALRAASGEGSG